MSKTKTLLCLLAQAVLIAGMVSYYCWTKKETTSICEHNTCRTKCEHTTVKRGVITGIMCTQEQPSAVIDGEIVYEGDTIHGVKVAKIHQDSIEFEEGRSRWVQHPQQEPAAAWSKKVD